MTTRAVSVPMTTKRGMLLAPWHITALQWSLAGNDIEFIAQRLASPLYGGIVTRREAKRLILA